MINNTNTLVSDGGGTNTSEETITFKEDLELETPIYLNELLYDTSNYYSAGLQDLVDGSVQIKSVESHSSENEIWDRPIIKEALNEKEIIDFEDYVKTIEEGDYESLSKYVDDCSTALYNNLIEFAEYSLEIEYLIAAIENELKSTLSTEDYTDFINSIKDNKSLNGIKSFSEDPSVMKYIGVGGKMIGLKFGLSMKSTGAYVWSVIKSNGVLSIIGLNHIQLLEDSIKRFVSGATSSSGNVAMFGSKILGSVTVAAAFFALGIGMDLATGNFSWENTAIKAAQAGVTAIGSYVGTTITEAIIEGGTLGSCAGLVGAVVGAAVSVLGNLSIDKIVHFTHYTVNDMPRNYDVVSVDNIKSILEENGYTGSSPTFSDNSNSSILDECTTLLSKGADPTFIKFVEQKAFGNSTRIMEPEDYQHYLSIHNNFLNYVKQGWFSIEDPAAVSEFKNIMKSQTWVEYRDTDDEYITNLFEFFSQDTPEVQDFFKRLTNGEILKNSQFDKEYR